MNLVVRPRWRIRPVRDERRRWAQAAPVLADGAPLRGTFPSKLSKVLPTNAVADDAISSTASALTAPNPTIRPRDNYSVSWTFPPSQPARQVSAGAASDTPIPGGPDNQLMTRNSRAARKKPSRATARIPPSAPLFRPRRHGTP